MHCRSIRSRPLWDDAKNILKRNEAFTEAPSWFPCPRLTDLLNRLLKCSLSPSLCLALPVFLFIWFSYFRFLQFTWPVHCYLLGRNLWLFVWRVILGGSLCEGSNGISTRECCWDNLPCYYAKELSLCVIHHGGCHHWWEGTCLLFYLTLNAFGAWHNIIQIHTSVLWDWQYSEEYSSHLVWIWEEYFLEYCQSHITVLWMWIMLWSWTSQTYSSLCLYSMNRDCDVPFS